MTDFSTIFAVKLIFLMVCDYYYVLFLSYYILATVYCLVCLNIQYAFTVKIVIVTSMYLNTRYEIKVKFPIMALHV